jgi:hypothetical protein
MKVTFVQCQAYQCKNITTDLYKEKYGAYCFKHTGKTKKPQNIEVKDVKLSAVSPRRVQVQGLQTTVENYEYNPMKVKSEKMKVPSPRRNLSFVPKTECGICKMKYDETDLMKCGHLVCSECLKENVRTVYCPFCNEKMEGPCITEKVFENLQNKYLEDLNKVEEEKLEESSESSSESEEELDFSNYNFGEDLQNDDEGERLSNYEEFLHKEENYGEI